MVITDNIENLLEELGFKRINNIFLNPNSKIVATKLVGNSLLFSWNGKTEKIIINDNFKDNLCRIMNSALHDKISKILNKISK